MPTGQSSNGRRVRESDESQKSKVRQESRGKSPMLQAGRQAQQPARPRSTPSRTSPLAARMVTACAAAALARTSRH